MTAVDLRERQYRMWGWGTSLLAMLAGWLILAQLSVDRPRQGPAPSEGMLDWVRTIVPTPARDLLVRQRVRDRVQREFRDLTARPALPVAPRVEMRPRGPLAPAASAERERAGRGLPELPGRSGNRPALPDRGRLLEGRGGESGGSGVARTGGGLDLRTEGAARGNGGRGASPDLRGRLLRLPMTDLDPALASFLGVQAGSLPGGALQLGGQPWQVWVADHGGLLRVLLRRGDELRLLVLTGPDLQLQSTQKGEVARARGGLVVQAQRGGAGEAAALREDLLSAVEGS
jgi:hypothetical protein